MHTDPIADMLTRIRNAQMVGKPAVVLPYSKIKLAILKLLESEGWIKDVEVIKAGLAKSKKTSPDISKFDQLKFTLLYDADGEGKIKSLTRISKPGRRFYAAKEDLPKVLNGYGIAIISTSKGLMTNSEARAQKLGGEVICEIY